MNFKNKISFEKLLLEAANRRLNDLDFFEEEINNDQALRIINNESMYLDMQVQSSNSIIESGKETESIKNLKLLNNIINSKLLAVSNFNNFYSEDIYKNILNIQHKVESLSSRVDETEIKIIEKSEIVHSNDFVKNKDMNDVKYGSIYNKDFKTGLSFGGDEFCEVVKGVGLTLPVKGLANVRPEKAYIVHEKSDAGDTKKAIRVSPINNVLKRNKIFSYIVLRQEKDSGFYKKETSYSEFPYSRISNFTFGLEFNSTNYFNNIRISSCSSIGYKVKNIRVLSTTKEWIDLEFEELEIFGDVNLFFPPISSKNLQITLEQKNIVGRSDSGINKQEDYSTNRMLNNLGFISNIGVKEEENIEGYYQDFSIRNVEVFLAEYKRKGCFISRPIETNGLYSCDIKSNIFYALDKIVTGYDKYEGEPTWHSNPENKVLTEFYLCLDLNKGSGLKYQEVVPLKDKDEDQKEFLVGSNERSKTKLFVDLRRENSKIKVSSIEKVTSMADILSLQGVSLSNLYIQYNEEQMVYQEVISETKESNMMYFYEEELNNFELGDTGDSYVQYIKLSFEQDHFLAQDDYVNLISTDSRLKGKTRVVSVPSSSSIIISAQNIGVSSNNYIQENFIDTFNENNYYVLKEETKPFLLYQDDIELTIGTDFFVSLDGGSNWFSYYPIDSSYDYYFEQAKAGDFCIKFKNLDTSSYYLIEYKHLHNQALSENRSIRLVNNNLFLNNELKRYNGNVRVMIVMRSGTPESYNSPIIQDYDFLIYQNPLESEEIENIKDSFSINKKRFKQHGS